MFTLNLADQTNTHILVTISSYPDGQQDLFIKGFLNLANPLTDIKGSTVLIKSKFNSIADLNLIKCAVACLRRLKVGEINLYIPYMLGARADRKFVVGGCSYIVDVIAPDLNSIGFNTITVLDVHSEVTPACLPNLDNQSVLPQLTYTALSELNRDKIKHCFVISPDAGASKRTYDTCKSLPSTDGIDIVECAKHREMSTGKILEIIVPKDDFGGDDVVIVDDICSKGGTFMGLAEKLKTRNVGKIILVVTHYEGTADIEKLKASGISAVYTTNSIGKFETSDGFIKQINVF
jgi:ribose-phosphate pyrophosphokinase